MADEAVGAVASVEATTMDRLMRLLVSCFALAVTASSIHVTDSHSLSYRNWHLRSRCRRRDVVLVVHADKGQSHFPCCSVGVRAHCLTLLTGPIFQCTHLLAYQGRHWQS